MTNGEKIQQDFECEVCEPIPEDDIIHVIFPDKNHNAIGFDLSWWNMEYKDPTTENNLSSGLEKNSKKLEKKFGELDCISRADAIKAMQDKAKKLKNEDTINGLCGAVAILFDMPSIIPQEPRWIPVSERYPKFKDEYKYFLVTDAKGRVRVEEFYISLDGEQQPCFSGMIDVIAWMPLPQPYKEVEK